MNPIDGFAGNKSSVSIPKRVLEALNQRIFDVRKVTDLVSIPKRVLEALNLSWAIIDAVVD